MTHTPLLIDLSDKRVLIFGSGKVAERKIKSFLGQTTISVVATEFSDFLTLKAETHTQLSIQTRDLKNLQNNEIETLLKDTFLVIPATSDHQFNENICSIAKSKNVLVNQVDSVGEVILPAIVRRGNIMMTVATAGQSPALSKFIKKKLAQTITAEYQRMSELQSIIRVQLKEKIDTQEQRKNIIWKILESNEVWHALEHSLEQGLLKAQTLINPYFKET